MCHWIAVRHASLTAALGGVARSTLSADVAMQKAVAACTAKALSAPIDQLKKYHLASILS